MIIVETPLKTIQRELESLSLQSIGGQTHLYVLGAQAALRWIAEGTLPPSNLYEIISRLEALH